MGINFPTATRLTLAAVIAVALAACAKTTVDDNDVMGEISRETVREISQGDLVGLETERGAHAWLGIRFAEAPDEELRYRAPRPPKPFDGRFEATVHGPRCPQMTSGLNRSEGVAAGLRVGDEDCLRVNVYAPKNALGGEPLPVMFWIHGGSNVWGRAKSYDPSDLVVNENVIVVTTQYRLGPLGWFSAEALREDAMGSNEPFDASANFGTLDLIAGLKWVQENISAFGGDASNVTIFGESAGGHNVVTLLASPAAKGLFHRAVIQSGSFASVSPDEAENGRDGLNNPASEVMKRLGAETADDLRRVSLDDLFAAYQVEKNGGSVDLPRVVADDPVLPTATLQEAFANTDTFNVVPIITGTNKDEMKLFQALDPRLVDARFGILIEPKDPGFYDALSEYQSRAWRVRSVDRAATLMASAGHPDVWGYRFDWDEGGSFLSTDFGSLFGAAHAFEIPFVMGRFKMLGSVDRFVFSRKTADSRRDLSRKMQRYWAAFARDGDPSDAGGILWPQYTSDGGAGAILR
ncbi:MAG: carboxylesterase family protein, partial [Pseudomonadota bacterium]